MMSPYSVHASITLLEGMLGCYIEMNRLREAWLTAHERLPGDIWTVDGMEQKAAQLVRSMHDMRRAVELSAITIEDTRRQLATLRAQIARVDSSVSAEGPL